MPTLTLEMPEDAFAALRRSPEEFARDMRLAAAIFWYSRGDLSQEEGARIAGLDRTDFILALAREKVDVIHVDMDELRRESSRG
jgi:predicted HTH domain antitoxin